jgi:hypothetical protein
MFLFTLSGFSVCSYLKLVRFTMGVSTVGQFVIMLKVMFFNDVLRFMGISGILIAAFSNAFYVLGGYQGWSGVGQVLYRAFQSFLGEGEVSASDGKEAHGGMWVYSLVFLIVGSLILVNVLIAMMGQTYESISTTAEVLATVETARLIREVELVMTPEQRLDPSKSWLVFFWWHLKSWVTGKPPPQPYWRTTLDAHQTDFFFPTVGPHMQQEQGEWLKYIEKNRNTRGGVDAN